MVQVNVVNHSNYGVNLRPHDSMMAFSIPAGTTMHVDISGPIDFIYYPESEAQGNYVTTMSSGENIYRFIHPPPQYFCGADVGPVLYEITNTGVTETIQPAPEHYTFSLKAVRDKKIKPGSIDDYYQNSGPNGTSLDRENFTIIEGGGQKTLINNWLVWIIVILLVIYASRHS